MNVASALTVANEVGALPNGKVTLGASRDLWVDLTFSWQFHMGDSRFSKPTGNFLGVRAEVLPDPHALDVSRRISCERKIKRPRGTIPLDRLGTVCGDRLCSQRCWLLHRIRSA
jgi:hypothetical protein